jgi:hypothetical protein
MTKEKIDEIPAPIFVVGAPRSGTTLTAKILGRHSRIFMPGETHFFDDIYARRRELGELSDAESLRKVIGRLRTLYWRYDESTDQQRLDQLLQKHDVSERLTDCRSYKDVLNCFMEIQMRGVGKIRWGNNVPKDIFHVVEIVSFYPDAKFIVCVRDVRDFLLSYKNRWKTTGGENAERTRKLYHPIITSLLWRANVKQIGRLDKSVPPGNCLIVRYEKLVKNPGSVVRGICRFIGEDFEQNMLEINEQNSSFSVRERGIYSSSVGRWRRGLTNEEVYTAQTLTKKFLGKLGYATENLAINPFRLGYIWATLPFSFWRAVHANKTIRGPLVPYLSRRITALIQ